MEQKVRALIKEAMVEKNKEKLLAYKGVLESAQKIAKADGNRAVSDADFVKAAKNEIKAQRDLAGFVQAGSAKALEIERKIAYCEILLPTMATETELARFLEETNVEKNIGACMKAMKQKFGDALDGKMAQVVAKKYISNIN